MHNSQLYFQLDFNPYNYDTKDVIKKVWIFKRKYIKGWRIGWYESGIRKAKYLPTKELAEQYRYIKYTQLNSNVFTGTVSANWSQILSEYRGTKKVQGVTEGTLYEIALSLQNFERLIGISNFKQITQCIIDKSILQRGNEVKRPTLNKDIRSIKAFISWCRKLRYLNGDIEIKELKEEERHVRSINDVPINKLLVTSEPYPEMKMHILLALGKGLRRGDIDTLKISNIDYEKKCMDSRPIPVEIIIKGTSNNSFWRSSESF